jgi:hypothetical protein
VSKPIISLVDVVSVTVTVRSSRASSARQRSLQQHIALRPTNGFDEKRIITAA